MRKEIEINGCIEIPPEMTMDEFCDAFIEWVDSKGWLFGGGFREIVDGEYTLSQMGENPSLIRAEYQGIICEKAEKSLWRS